MTQHHYFYRYAILAALSIAAVTAKGQTSLKELTPTVYEEMKGACYSEFISTDSTISYSFYTDKVSKDSLSGSFQNFMRVVASTDMEHASEADHYVKNKDGVRTETFTLRNDSLKMKAQLELGDNVYFLFTQQFNRIHGFDENISISLDKYLKDKYGKYLVEKDKESNFVEFVSPDGNSIITPTLQTTYSLPHEIATKANEDIAVWLQSNVFSTSYSKIWILKRNMQVNYSADRNADVYYFMPQTDGSMTITKFAVDKSKENDNAKNKSQTSNLKPQPSTLNGMTLQPDGEWTNVWNFPIADKGLPADVGTVFSLERRSDVTIMHIRKRLYSDKLGTWTDDSQTFLVDEETQVHYRARGCSPSEIWGKMIRIHDMAEKTIALDVYFPPLPPGVSKFSVWGLRRFGVPSEHLFYMKRDGDLYIDR